MTTIKLNRLVLLFALAIILSPATRSASGAGAKSSEEESQQAGQQKLKVAESAKDGRDANDDRDGQGWFNRGYALHSADRYPEAIEAFKHSIDLGYRKATAMYNIACGYSLLNDKENALAWLERALHNGFSRTDLLRGDSDLDPVRTDFRFRKILDSTTNAGGKPMKERAQPDRLEQAQLDFARLDREASKDGNEWHNVGRRLLMLRDLDRAVAALNSAVVHLDYRGSTAMYNLACAYALKGDRNKGMDWLEKSIRAGFDNNERVQNDPDIISLRADPRFSRIEKSSRLLSLSQFYKDGFDGSRYSTGQWAPAVKLYESLVQSEPNNGRAWFNLGYALHYSREHARAIEAFEHARQLDYNRPVTHYNIACAYSMLGQRELAFEWLERAVDEGYEANGYINSDRDLDNLRSDPRFQRFIRLARDEKRNEK
jgi:tetratricopeptide (TPR) repeat protein